MIWLTWRQHRIEALVTVLILVLLGTLLIISGFNIITTFKQLGLADCLSQPGQNCGNADVFEKQFRQWTGLIPWLNLVPAFVGMFVGAPLLARELEQHTHRMVWTQSVSRLHWFVVKIGLIAVVALLAELIVTGLVSWWRGPFDQIEGSLTPNQAFEFEGIVPLAYLLFALMLGVALGALIGRTVITMFLTLVGFLGLRLFILNFVRPNFMPMLENTFNLNETNPRANLGDWVIDNTLVDSQGHVLSNDELLALCPKGASRGIFEQCLQAHNFRNVTYYQPADRFWLFQGMESLIYLGLSILLISVTIWWLKHKLT
jgi:hypothetical protein